MNIVHALFVPNGTISKSGFLIAALVLIAVGVVSDWVSFAMPSLAPVFFFIGLVAAYCWVALWIKRFHAAGTSGWWTILVAFVWLIVEMIVGFAVIAASGLDMSVFASGDSEAIQAAMEPAVEAAAVPAMIASVVVSLVIALGLNAILPEGRWRADEESAA
ncbi:MAG: hypothetical protein ACFE0P_13970 [Oceanicaulis sp.]